MAPQEVYKYTDRRGDTITYKFDVDLINSHSDDALTVYHYWVHHARTTTQWSSILLDPVSAAERWRSDKKPMTGLVLWSGNLGGKRMVVRFVGYDRCKKGYIVETTGAFA